MVCGLDFGPEYQEQVRVLFIDVLTRRYLLRAVTVLRLTQKPGALVEEIHKINLRPMEDYYADLPACLKGHSYVGTPDALNQMFFAQEREIMDFLKQFDSDLAQDSQESFPFVDSAELNKAAKVVEDREQEKFRDYILQHFEAFRHLGRRLYTPRHEKAPTRKATQKAPRASQT